MQVRPTPMPSPETPFTVASGPMSPHVKIEEVADGIQLSVREQSVVLPTTMALHLARVLLNLSLGDRHATTP